MNLEQWKEFLLKAVEHCQDCRSQGKWVKSTHVYPDIREGITPMIYDYNVLCESCYEIRKAESK